MGKHTHTVLIIDDEQDVTDFLSMALEDAGFNTVVACDGMDALEKMEKTIPDVISLDVVMPKGSGVKFYRELKKNKEWADIPVIIVTGHARDELGKADFQEMTLSGPGVYLEKPVTAAGYVRAVHTALGNEQGEQDEEKDRIKKEVASLLDNADVDILKEITDIIKSKMK
jgi:CheY-like chemotaxis protein